MSNSIRCLMASVFAVAFSSLAVALVVVCAVRSETVSGLEAYGDLTLVDSIDCATDTVHEFHQYPEGGSKVETILSAPCRTLAHQNGSAAYFSYRLGKGKGLVPGDMYLLVAEYPDDVPRTMTLINRAMDSRNGFHTGRSIGDTLNAHIIPQTHCESLEISLSGTYKRIEQLMVLNENVYPYNSTNSKDFLKSATDGFDVVFQLFTKQDAPDSAGAAIRSVRLYHVNDESSLEATINYPADAPRRYLTFREEMSKHGGRSFNTDWRNWSRYKARLMKVLGLNCYSRDMLEFGYNQFFDVTCGGKYNDGDSWCRQNEDYYTDEVAAYAAAGVYLMPFYEYAGSRGTSGLGYNSFRKAVPLFDSLNTATHGNKFVQSSNGASAANVDLTDEAAYSDFKRFLECTILRYKEQANFVGAWIRNRGSMPVSFSDNTLGRFNAETGHSETRATILAAAKATAGNTGMSDGDVFRNLISMNQQPDVYKEYRAWWYGKRADFFAYMQKYLVTNGVTDAKILYSGCLNESGLTGKLGDYYNQYDDFVAAQDADAWKSLSGSSKDVKSIGVAGGYEYPKFFLGMDEWTWYPYEYNHAAPKNDPETYTNRANVAIAYPYNCIYTTIPGEAAKYRNATDDLFFSRHYCLYEGCGSNADNQELNGYFTCDMDRADRASMLPELYAVAYQDPTTIGFLQGNQLARNFTIPFKEFAENFLSLPAVKGSVVQGGGWGLANPTIRKYVANGVQYYAVVNLSGEPIASAWHVITDDTSVTKLYETVSGTEHAVGSNYMRYEMKPYQLLCFSTEKPSPPQDDTPRCEFGEIEAAVDLGGTNATIRTTVVDVNGAETKVELKVNGETVNTWTDVHVADVLEFKSDVARGSTNVYAFVFTSGEVEVTSDPGVFVATTYTDWFTVDFENDDAYVNGTDWANVPADRGSWTVSGESELKDKAYVTLGDSPAVYRPTKPSEDNADAKVWGRTKVTDGGIKVDLSDMRPCVALTFIDLVPYVYVNGAWLALEGGTPLVIGAPVDYTVSFRFMETSVPPTVMFTVGDWTSPWVSAADMPRKLSSLDFGANGEFGSFHGAYYSLLPEGAVIELEMPEFTKDGSALRLEDAKFSMTISNPVKDAWYTVFIAEKLTDTFKAAEDSAQFSADTPTFTLTVDADKPSLFAKIVISSAPYKVGDEL